VWYSVKARHNSNAGARGGGRGAWPPGKILAPTTARNFGPKTLARPREKNSLWPPIVDQRLRLLTCMAIHSDLVVELSVARIECSHRSGLKPRPKVIAKLAAQRDKISCGFQ